VIANDSFSTSLVTVDSLAVCVRADMAVTTLLAAAGWSCDLFDPIIREVASPVTEQMLRPLDPQCRWVQSSRALSDTGWSPVGAAHAFSDNLRVRLAQPARSQLVVLNPSEGNDDAAPGGAGHRVRAGVRLQRSGVGKRVAQEALTNVRRHAYATGVTVTLHVEAAPPAAPPR
jgi:hypothetical protein